MKLAPGEAFLVNGVRLENGQKPARIRITDNDARVLRCSDALKPEDVNTPVKQIYFAVQLLITGDIEAANALPAIDTACLDLESAFSHVDVTIVSTLREMIRRGNYYSALCYIKQLLIVEEGLLGAEGPPSSPLLVRNAA